MRGSLVGLAVAALILAGSPAARADAGDRAPHRLGFGAHYWKTLDQLKDDHKSIDDNGISWVGSYQYAFPWLKLEGDVEVFPKGYYGSTETTLAPQALLLLGDRADAGAGIGAVYARDLDKRLSDPIYTLRAGLDLELLPRLHLDVNANYYFAEWEDWDRFDTDTVTLGGQVRLAF